MELLIVEIVQAVLLLGILIVLYRANRPEITRENKDMLEDWVK